MSFWNIKRHWQKVVQLHLQQTQFSAKDKKVFNYSILMGLIHRLDYELSFQFVCFLTNSKIGSGFELKKL